MKVAGWIAAQLNTAEDLFKELDLLEERNRWVTYPVTLPGVARDLSYLDEFKMYTQERLFDFRLADHALFQFKVDPDGNPASYCYYQAPFDVPTYRDFVAEQLQDSAIDFDEIGSMFMDDYEQAVDTANLRKSVTPVRYDYSPDQYEAGLHPAAHLHIGTGNEIRLCTSRLMQPLSFVLFVLRQIYPDPWRRVLCRDDAKSLCRAVREDLETVDSAYLSDLDRLQLVLD